MELDNLRSLYLKVGIWIMFARLIAIRMQKY